MMDELMTTAEVAALSRRHEDTVLVAARNGQLESHQAAVRGSRKYWRKDVIDWIERGAPWKASRRRKLRAAS